MIAFLDASALIYLVDGDTVWSGAVQQVLQGLAADDPSLANGISLLCPFFPGKPRAAQSIKLLIL